MSTAAVTQLRGVREFFDALEWWSLVPDESTDIITAGRGEKLLDDVEIDVLDNDYLTSARLGNGSLIAYVPTARTLTLDLAKLGHSRVARWVDPANATAPPVEAAIAPSGALPTPGLNSAGGEDWLLLLQLQA
jgi:hypothetical protein